MYAPSHPSPQQCLPIGRFHFTDIGNGPVGQGGLGQVFRIRITQSNAFDVPVGSEWARKKLNQRWAQHPVMRERFEREIQAVQKMKHRNIITLHGQNVEGGERFYIMPFFTSNLRRFIAEGTYTGNWRTIANLGAELAEALHYAHGCGFIHRDLKPDNILFNHGGPLIIADWGLGYFVHQQSVVLQQLTRGGMGTEYYCSAEQWATGKCDGRGDVYSLGMTLDEWVTGRQRPIVVGQGVNGDAVLADCIDARRFNQLLRAMTHPSKLNRPPNMQIVAADLRSLSRGA